MGGGGGDGTHLGDERPIVCSFNNGAHRELASLTKKRDKYSGGVYRFLHGICRGGNERNIRVGCIDRVPSMDMENTDTPKRDKYSGGVYTNT